MPLPGLRFPSKAGGPVPEMLLVAVGGGNLRSQAQDGDVIVVVGSQSGGTSTVSYPATPSGYTSIHVAGQGFDGHEDGYVSARTSIAVANSATRTTGIPGTDEATLIMRHPYGRPLTFSFLTTGSETHNAAALGADCVGYIHCAMDADFGLGSITVSVDTGTVEGLEDSGERHDARSLFLEAFVTPGTTYETEVRWEIAGWVRENYAENASVSLSNGVGANKRWIAVYTA